MIGIMLEDEEANALSFLLQYVRDTDPSEMSRSPWEPQLEGVATKLEQARVDASTDTYLYQVNEAFKNVHSQAEAEIVERNFNTSGDRASPL